MTLNFSTENVETVGLEAICHWDSATSDITGKEKLKWKMKVKNEESWFTWGRKLGLRNLKQKLLKN